MGQISVIISRNPGSALSANQQTQFVPWLKRACHEPIQYLTVFRRGRPEIERQAHATGDVIETIDGLKVAGEAFFNGFQLEEEEAV
ncbi:hypothetical protein [Shinella sp. HZN7]|uniref:hypothetical protein n=1 Tax=Shinella sp. (strain HZN7) TaxID=879274 RepID=UPI0007DA7B2D|nr:hypothetical protein [Shinella sp. HZN7]ANH08454.1 hypothetical protein shn_30375 [Shinella sp. HZN7]